MAHIGSEKQVYANRTNARGVLVAILAGLAVFSFMWYLLVPRTGFATVEPDNTAAVSLSGAEPIYLLLVGSDSLRGTALYTGMPNSPSLAPGRADVITLVRVDPSSHKITLLSIPRDTYCAESEEKLQMRFNENRPEDLVAEVEELAGVEVDYYLFVSFSAFENIIDDIGGVVVDVPASVSVLDPAIGKEVQLRQGNAQLLDGSQALALASYIDETDPLGDARRQTNVRNIELAMIDRVTSGGEDGARRAITALRENTTTNIDHTLLVSLAIDYVIHSQDYQFYSGSAPYEITKQESGRWAIVPDLAEWQALMSLVDSGQDPNYVVRAAEPIVVLDTPPAASSSKAASSPKASSSSKAASSSKASSSSKTSSANKKAASSSAKASSSSKAASSSKASSSSKTSSASKKAASSNAKASSSSGAEASSSEESTKAAEESSASAAASNS